MNNDYLTIKPKLRDILCRKLDCQIREKGAAAYRACSLLYCRGQRVNIILPSGSELMEDFRTEEFYNTLIFVERLQNNSLNIPDKETVNHTSTQANEQNLVRCQVTCTLFDLKVPYLRIIGYLHVLYLRKAQSLPHKTAPHKAAPDKAAPHKAAPPFGPHGAVPPSGPHKAAGPSGPHGG
ncbi:uncharacterized protein LOC143922238 isoform X2 [Arctopsyche grandis]|uniref:uncharacterized protein LOC143922236 isoform X2 n=1 Tax=Arctopsyche grandis TaxID=121162 RepID=UPI00406D6668